MRSHWLAFVWMGCESMDTPGNPLVAADPVGQGADVASISTDEGGDESQPEGTFSFEEPQIIPSEDLVPDIDQPDDLDGGEDTPTVDLAPEAPGAVASDSSQPSLVNPPTATPAPWPIRLVQTVTVANPPRAILGLPDGSEVVVTPGQMLPEHRLIIMSIGPETIQVVKVRAEGDHAVIDSMTLQSMY